MLNKQNITDIRNFDISINMDNFEPVNTNIKLKQYDYGTNKFIIDLIKNDKMLNLNNYTITIMFINSIGENINVINSEVQIINNYINFYIPDYVIMYDGNVRFEVLLFDNKNRITTQTMTFDILPSITDYI